MSDRILFPCPACQKRIRARANKAGQTVHCPQCNAAVVVPGADPDSPASPSTPQAAPPQPATRQPASPPPAKPQTAKPQTAKPQTAAPQAPARQPASQTPGQPSSPPRAKKAPQQRSTPPPESVSLSKKPSGDAPAQPRVPAQLSAPPVANPKPKSKQDVKTISVRCGSCSTAVDAPVSLIGKSVRCPDCHDSIPVRAKKAESQSSSGKDDEATKRAHRGLGKSTQSFGFACTLCGTRLYAEPSQIGKELTCPDCHSEVRVPTPTRSAPKGDVAPPDEDSNDADFNLEDASERPKYQPTNRGKVSRDDMEMLGRTSALAPRPSTSPPNPSGSSPAAPLDPEESRLTASPTPAATPRQRPTTESPPTQSPPTQRPPTQRPPTQRPPTQGPPTQGSQDRSAAATRKPKDGVSLAAVCPHCHTRLGFREDQIGKRVRCGDCHGEFVVKPAEKKAALSEPAEATDDDEFALSDVVERPVIDPMAHRSLANAEQAAQQTAGTTETINPLATAEQEAVEEEEERTDISDVGYFRRTLGLFLQGEAIARCCLLVIMDACMCWLISGGSSTAQADGVAQAYTIVYILLGVAVFIPLCLGTMANVFAITADTAAGAQIVETWPEDIFSDWIGNAVTMFVICVVSGLPGSLLAIGARELVADPALSFLVMGLSLGCGFCVVFPIVLLSVLEGDGLGSMVSPPVIRSVAIAKKSWALFYVEAIALAALMIPVYLVINRPIFALLLVASAWKFFLMFIYFRLLGVLGFRVAKALNEHDGNLLDDDSEE